MAARTISILKFVGTVSLGISTVRAHPPPPRHARFQAHNIPLYSRKPPGLNTNITPGHLRHRLCHCAPLPPRPPYRRQRTHNLQLSLHQVSVLHRIPAPHCYLHTLFSILDLATPVQTSIPALHLDPLLRFGTRHRLCGVMATGQQ
jgi:hypothetical protein